jgi:hypothetical protein
MNKVTTAFISGHIDIEYDTFIMHYKQKIDDAYKNDHKFVLGAASGVDLFALKYLLNIGVLPKDITIYYYNKYDNNGEQFYLDLNVNVVKGFKSYTERDACMTKNSDYDIAWVRSDSDSKILYGDKYDPNKKSGTEQNLLRRKKLLENKN